MREGHERRYPPTPYPPRSEDTRLYRDGWDRGWEQMGTIGVSRARDYYEGMSEGPAKHGYRDGARARWRRLQTIAAADAEARARAREHQRREWAAEAMDEGPY